MLATVSSRYLLAEIAPTAAMVQRLLTEVSLKLELALQRRKRP